MPVLNAAPRALREDSMEAGAVMPCAYWLGQAEVPEDAFWEAVRARVGFEPGVSQIDVLLSEARKASGMDSTFLVRDDAISHCVNGGPLKLIDGQHLAWFAKVSEELVAANSWQTHGLDAERADASLGLPLRVKTLFVLPVEGAGTAAGVKLCGISQMRVVMGGAQLHMLNQLAARLAPMVSGGTVAIDALGAGKVPTTITPGKVRKAGRRPVFGHVFGGRDAVTRRIAGR